MPCFKDLTGQKYGRLTVIKMSKRAQSGRRERFYWLCICECGNKKEVRTDCLTRGQVTSCGCLKKEQDRENLTKNHRHKLSRSKLWHTYYSIKKRCYNPKDSHYKYYGGRGIKMCAEWAHSFDSFAEWALKNGFDKGLQIDRIDNDGDYCPKNCRWVTLKENCRNRRSNVLIDYNGGKITLSEFAEKNNIPYSVAYSRYRRFCVKRDEI